MHCGNWLEEDRMGVGIQAREQGVRRWADNTPFHLLYIEEIKKTIPNAQFVHMIRDGRDVAMS
jgi:hypothetical protein